MFCTVETKRKPLNSLNFRGFHLFAVILRGATRNRTGDTRIFSPLLYQLSYGTIVFTNAGAKILLFSGFPNILRFFFMKYLAFLWKVRIFAPAKQRKVAQLVAHYVRDVGVGRSSRLFPTGKAKG